MPQSYAIISPENLIMLPNELRLRLLEQEELLHMVAHDLRNPLGGVKALSSLLLSASYERPEQDEMLTAIRAAADQSLRLVENLLKS